MAAAIGAGLDIDEPFGRMVVDIGGGTTEVAVITLSAIAYSESVRVAGDETNEAVIRYIQKHHQMAIGENMAEEAKIAIGNAFPQETPSFFRIKGKDILNGNPKSLNINDTEMREAISEPVQVIIQAIRRALDKTAPELAADILDSGITLAGGGALIKGLGNLITQETNLKVNLTDAPLLSVVQGAGTALEQMNKFRKVFIS